MTKWVAETEENFKWDMWERVWATGEVENGFVVRTTDLEEAKCWDSREAVEAWLEEVEAGEWWKPVNATEEWEL